MVLPLDNSNIFEYGVKVDRILRDYYTIQQNKTPCTFNNPISVGGELT